ncbi:formin-like protein 3 isoform X1 [Zingiber officinale]|uniref:formin-like protein 3 isoform X1 n=2 Tax=Zingiber officinale TaxID=94328 RepID=UPI001C4D6B21|nr:formin-like protein 3 isoform X1 [Zingiber officinale]
MVVEKFVIAIVIVFLFLSHGLLMHGSEGKLVAADLSLKMTDSMLIDYPLLHEYMGRMYGYEVVNTLHPKVKHAVNQCFIRRGFDLDLAKDDYRLNSMHIECLELITNWLHVHGRHLTNQSPRSVPNFSLDVGKFPAPAAGSTPSLSASPKLTDEQLTSAPAISQSPDLAPTSSASLHHYSIVLSISSPKPLKIAPAIPSSSHGDQQDRTKLVIIAVVLSSTGTSILLLCIFCCYWKFCRQRQYLVNGKDERPLLHLCNVSGLSNLSFGPVGLSNQTDNLGGLPSDGGLSQNDHVLYEDFNPNSTSLSDIVSSTQSFGLKNSSESKTLPLPPGRSTIPLSAPHHPTAAVPPPSAPPPPPPPPPPVIPPATKAAPPPSAPPLPFPNRKSGAQIPSPPERNTAVQPPPPSPNAAFPPLQVQGNSRTKQPPSFELNHFISLNADSDKSGPKTKLKPFFWDKVLANSQSNVWSHIRSGSFQFDEEMIESLFGYNNAAGGKVDGKKESTSGVPSPQFIQLLEPKKSQNLAISLKALNIKKHEVSEALMEGNELPTTLLQALLRMQPTTDEELKLRSYTGDLSFLAPAEQFLKELINIPFAYKRMDVLLFMSLLHEDVSIIKESFAILEVACAELRNNRLFLKILEAVLKTGNRMNDGTFHGGAEAFKLDTLLKLADVKGTDKKTTLLHFVVKETIRSEGRRAARLARESGYMSILNNYNFSNDSFEDSKADSEERLHAIGLEAVSGLSSELNNVKKAAGFDIDATNNSVASFGRKLVEIKEFLNKDMRILEEESGFHHSLECFVEHAESAITFLLEEQKRIRSLVQRTTDYFHGSAAKDEGLRLFIIVRDFLVMLDKICTEVKKSSKKVSKPVKKNRDISTETPSPGPRQLLFPAIRDRQVDSSSSDEEDL